MQHKQQLASLARHVDARFPDNEHVAMTESGLLLRRSELEPERLAPTIRYGYALMLRGAAADGWRGPLEARLLESQGRLAG